MFNNKKPPRTPADAAALGAGLFVDKSNPARDVLDAEAGPSTSTSKPNNHVIDVEDVREVRVKPSAPLAEAVAEPKVTTVGGLRVTSRGASPAPTPTPTSAAPAEAPQVSPKAVASSKGGLRGLVKAKPAEDAAPATSRWGLGGKKSASAEDSHSEPKPGVLAGLLKPKSALSPEPKSAAELPTPQVSTSEESQMEPPAKALPKGLKAMAAKAAAPVTPSEPKPKKRWGFKLSKAADEAPPVKEEGTQESAASKTSLKGLWGKKAAKAEPTAKAKKNEKKKSGTKKLDVKAISAHFSSGPKKSKGPLSSIDVMVELENELQVIWRVSATGLQEIKESTLSHVVSFSSKDRRYTTPTAISYAQAQNLALADIGEDCRIVNASKALGVVYASVASRIATYPYLMAPGAAVVDMLMSTESSQEQKDLIVGLLLADEASQHSLVVLYHKDVNGELSVPQITMNPNDLHFTLSQFASSKRVDVDSAEVVLFKNEDLLKTAGSLDYYPAEPVWHGVPVRSVLWSGALASSVVAIVLAGNASVSFIQKSSLESKAASLRSQVTQIDRQLQTDIANSLEAFAKTQTVALDASTERAAQLWMPRTKVTMEVTAAAERYEMTLALKAGNAANNRPSALQQLTAEDLAPFVSLQAPEGCTKNIPNISGGVDALQIIVTCESAPSSLHRYRSD